MQLTLENDLEGKDNNFQCFLLVFTANRGLFVTGYSTFHVEQRAGVAGRRVPHLSDADPKGAKGQENTFVPQGTLCLRAEARMIGFELPSWLLDWFISPCT